VSLILEALRKLEREKQTPERGFLVLGTGAWAERGHAGRPIAVFLFGLLLGAVALGVLMRSRSSPAAAVAHLEPAPAPTAIAPTPHAVPPPATLTATKPAGSAALRTPTEPASEISPAAAQATPAPRPSAPAFTLQAISEKDGHTVALINDRLLRQGDAIDGARVVAIAKDSVELEIAGRRVVLRF